MGGHNRSIIKLKLYQELVSVWVKPRKGLLVKLGVEQAALRVEVFCLCKVSTRVSVFRLKFRLVAKAKMHCLVLKPDKSRFKQFQTTQKAIIKNVLQLFPYFYYILQTCVRNAGWACEYIAYVNSVSRILMLMSHVHYLICIFQARDTTLIVVSRKFVTSLSGCPRVAWRQPIWRSCKVITVTYSRTSAQHPRTTQHDMRLTGYYLM